MRITKFVTYKWILGILNIQQTVGFLLLLCLLFTVSFPVSIPPPTFNNYNSPDSQTVINQKKEKEGKNAIQRFITLLKDSKDAPGENAEKCPDGGLLTNNLLKSTDVIFFVDNFPSDRLTELGEIIIKDWCISKRYKILSKISTLRLYLFLRLKLPC